MTPLENMKPPTEGATNQFSNIAIDRLELGIQVVLRLRKDGLPSIVKDDDSSLPIDNANVVHLNPSVVRLKEIDKEVLADAVEIELNQKADEVKSIDAVFSDHNLSDEQRQSFIDNWSSIQALAKEALSGWSYTADEFDEAVSYGNLGLSEAILESSLSKLSTKARQTKINNSIKDAIYKNLTERYPLLPKFEGYNDHEYGVAIDVPLDDVGELLQSSINDEYMINKAFVSMELKRLLKDYKAVDQEMFFRCVVLGETQKEVAESLNIPMSKVSIIINYIRNGTHKPVVKTNNLAVPMTENNSTRNASKMARQTRRKSTNDKSIETKVSGKNEARVTLMDDDAMLHIIKKHPLLTAKQELDLARAYQKGDLSAKDKLVSCNMRLVMSQARRYQSISDLTLSDLVQEGTIGLIRAIEKFDPDKGFKISTYATLWIRQALQRATQNKGNMIRMPVHAAQKLRKVEKAETIFAQYNNGQMPNVVQLAEITGFDLDEIMFMKDTVLLTSLDAPVGNTNTDTNRTIGDYVASNAKSPLELTLEEELKAKVEEAIGSLKDDRQKSVVRLHFGIDKTGEHSIADISKMMKISTSTARLLLAAALKNLRPHLEGLEIQSN